MALEEHCITQLNIRHSEAELAWPFLSPGIHAVGCPCESSLRGLAVGEVTWCCELRVELGTQDELKSCKPFIVPRAS